MINCLFIHQLAANISNGRTRSGSGDVPGLHCGLVYIAAKVSCASGLDYPTCYCRYCEVADDADYHKNDVHGIAGIRYIGRVGKHRYIPFEYEGLYSCQHRAEQVRNG